MDTATGTSTGLDEKTANLLYHCRMIALALDREQQQQFFKTLLSEMEKLRNSLEQQAHPHASEA